MVKVFVVPLQTLQPNLLHQVLRKIPTAPLYRLRKTCTFFNTHIEENKGKLVNRSFDPELDLLWSNSISCPNLQLQYVDNVWHSEISIQWGKYKETVHRDSDFQSSINWNSESFPLVDCVDQMFTSAVFGNISVYLPLDTIETHYVQIAITQMEMRLENMNLHCETLYFEQIPLEYVLQLSSLVKYGTLLITALQENWQDYLMELDVLTDLHPKLHVAISSTQGTNAVFETVRKMQGFTIRKATALDFTVILEDLYSSKQSCNLKNLRFYFLEKITLTIEIPYEILWDRSTLPRRLQKEHTPHAIYSIQLQGKIALVTIYNKHNAMEIQVDIIEQNQRSVFAVLKKKLHIWESRKEEEYISADVDSRKEIIREEFLASRNWKYM